ncbi:hypothetical protein ACFYOT_31995 [Saccharothrix saharensis]
MRTPPAPGGRIPRAANRLNSRLRLDSGWWAGGPAFTLLAPRSAAFAEA